MEKITFVDNVTKANAETFNTMQDNIEEAINEVNTYSTDEIRIGTFLGENLYRKVFELTTYNTIYDLTINGVKDVTDVKIKLYRNDYSNISQIVPSRITNEGFKALLDNIIISNNNVQLQLDLGTAWSTTLAKIRIIVEYTKTTD